MTFNRVVQVVLGGCLALSQTIKTYKSPNIVTPSNVVAIDEILSYECARSITSLIGSDEQIGPVFSRGQLVFTSVEAQDSSKLLIVNAGSGNFVVPLESSGVNRIRFEVPTAQRGQLKVFFLSYMHGGTL